MPPLPKRDNIAEGEAMAISSSKAQCAEEKASSRKALLHGLRQDIATLEETLSIDQRLHLSPTSKSQKTNPSHIKNGIFTFGLNEMDKVFSKGGLTLAGVHEIHSSLARHNGAASGFLLALLSLIAAEKPGIILWISDRHVEGETGTLYGPGLHQYGLSPERFLFVQTRNVSESLWAMEEGLMVRGVSACIIDMRGHAKALNLAACRRLMLRAVRKETPAFFLRTSHEGQHLNTASSRWRVGPASAGTINHYEEGVGRSAFSLTLEKNRDGQTGHWICEWNTHVRSFTKSAIGVSKQTAPHKKDIYKAPHSGSLVSNLANRSSQKTAKDNVRPFKRAS